MYKTVIQWYKNIKKHTWIAEILIYNHASCNINVLEIKFAYLHLANFKLFFSCVVFSMVISSLWQLWIYYFMIIC